MAATAASVLDGDSLLLRFPAPVPAGAVLDYAWGISRLAGADGSGAGHALTDAAGLPAWTPATGVRVGEPAAPTGDPATEDAAPTPPAWNPGLDDLLR